MISLAQLRDLYLPGVHARSRGNADLFNAELIIDWRCDVMTLVAGDKATVLVTHADIVRGDYKQKITEGLNRLLGPEQTHAQPSR